MNYLVCSCSPYPSDVEKALKYAGDNRGQLEQVLEHYSKTPADSLKLRAAQFLIANMPGHWSYNNDTFKFMYSVLKRVIVVHIIILRH
ncbi:MAG: hypothetical protein AB2L24_18840 [Mangrovibacterium sp.]